MKEKKLKKDHILTGEIMYSDHYILRSPGQLFHMRGNTDPSEMFSGGCIFVDHASGFMIINHQVDINATGNVTAQLTFEREDQSQGVFIKG